MPEASRQGPIISHALVAVATAVAIVIAEALLESWKGTWQSWIAIGAVGILMMLSVVMSLLAYSWMVGPIITQHMSGITTDLARVSQHLEKLSLGVHENLITTQELMQMEQLAGEICVVTRDFYWDVEHPFGSIAIQNIVHRSKRYTYFCPKGGRSEEAIKQITDRLPKTSSVFVSYLPAEQLAANPFEFVIYDPKDDGRTRGAIIDVFWKRYSEPQAAIDMKMDRDNVLPRFRKLILQWSADYVPVEYLGTL